MNKAKSHINFKILSVVLVISLITPTLVKFAHVFENHKHEVCISKQQAHLHTLDLDCEFYKFKVNNAFTFKAQTFNLLSIENNHKVFSSQYEFISDYQRLSFSLRGPPQLV
ncbi:hypothetical protein ACFS5M_08090 [Lacinutrix iliipiscaria]|uniref:Transmembrane protein n=1 Tax=Lacinutrix iliipiscaria TaxID=1230532 RepID=A0ABW5WQC4_9FLAO